MVKLTVLQILALVGVGSLLTLVGLGWLLTTISARYEDAAGGCLGRMVALSAAAAALRCLYRDHATLVPGGKASFTRAAMFDRLALEHLETAVESAKDGHTMWYKEAYRTLNSGQGQLFGQVLTQADAICHVQEQAPLALVRDCGLGP